MPVAMRLRALALHGFGQDAAVFEKKRTKDLQRRLKHLLTLSCIDAPLELPESAGQRCWWNYGPEAWDGLDKEALQLWATRPELLTSEKINAIGIDRTIEVLCDEWRSGGYDGVLGFSQGATAVAILCAKLLDAGEPLPKFAILISGPMLVPHDLPFYPPKAPLEVPSLHIRGMQDNIPSESVRALAALFEASNREFMEHGGGHFVPSKSSDVQVIEHFLERFVGQARSTDRAQLTLATSLVQSAEQDILDKKEAAMEHVRQFKVKVDAEKLQRFSEQLKRDEHCECRNRGYAAFLYEYGHLKQLPDAPFRQDGVNELVEARKIPRDRIFGPLPQGWLESPACKAAVMKTMEGVGSLKGGGSVETATLGMHFIKVNCGESAGTPAPEGRHQDGFDFVSTTPLERVDVQGGESSLAVGPHTEAFYQQVLAPGCGIVFDDRKLWHDVTPVEVAGPACHGYRSVLVITVKDVTMFQGLQAAPSTDESI